MTYLVRLLVFDGICVCNAERMGIKLFSVTIHGESVSLIDLVTI